MGIPSTQGKLIEAKPTRRKALGTALGNRAPGQSENSTWEILTKRTASLFNRLPADPRLLQITALGSLYSYGALAGVFVPDAFVIASVFIAALTTQFIGSLLNATRFEARSAAITSLSLLLLLRADSPSIMAIAASIAVGSKFFIRLQGKHIFNPANIGIVSLLMVSAMSPAGTTLSGIAWTTPGQWGTAVWLAALFAGVGFVVTSRAARLDVPLAFLLTFAFLALARAVWLGDPFTIPLHRLQNGALVLFAFFMISDPKTTPDSQGARFVFAALTALLAHYLIYFHFISDGIFYALAISCIVRPVIDAVVSAPAYQWPTKPRLSRGAMTKSHETSAHQSKPFV